MGVTSVSVRTTQGVSPARAMRPGRTTTVGGGVADGRTVAGGDVTVGDTAGDGATVGAAHETATRPHVNRTRSDLIIRAS